MCYFDPMREDISIRVLTAPERAARLAGRVSVSALETETRAVTGDQIQLFDENGS